MGHLFPRRSAKLRPINRVLEAGKKEPKRWDLSFHAPIYACGSVAIFQHCGLSLGQMTVSARVRVT